MKSKAKLDHKPCGPSLAFIGLTRNPVLAANPPVRFEPTVKGVGDVVI